MLCSVYKSDTKELTYLYLVKGAATDTVPADLLAHFGQPVWVLDVKLDDGRQLALADAGEVSAAIERDGYYLQMPPGGDHPLRRW